MLMKSDLTSKDTSLWSSGIGTILIASIKLSAEVVEMSVANNSPSQASNHPDDHFQSRPWVQTIFLKCINVVTTSNLLTTLPAK